MIRDVCLNIFKNLIVIVTVIKPLFYKKSHINKLLQFIVITTLSVFSINLMAKNTKIVMYGDSISAGYGMQLHQSWPHLLNEHFKNEKIDISFVNESISGETTGGGVARISEVIERHQLTKNDWLIIELGGNDGLRGFPIKTIKNNLTLMIEASQLQGINVAVMQIQVPPNYGKRYSTMFSDIYPDLVNQFELTLLPFFMEEIAINPNYMMNDKLHPNVSAQVIIRDMMKPLVLSLASKK